MVIKPKVETHKSMAFHFHLNASPTYKSKSWTPFYYWTLVFILFFYLQIHIYSIYFLVFN